MGLGCTAHEGLCAIGSKSEERSYVGGTVEEAKADDGMNSAIEINGGGAMVVACGEEGGGGWGNSRVARWPCK